MGAAGIGRGRRSAHRTRAARRAVFAAGSASARIVARPKLHGARISARVLSALSRLFGLFSAMGARGLSRCHAPRSRTLRGSAFGARRHRGGAQGRGAHLGIRESARPSASALRGGALLAVSGIGNDAATRAARMLVDAGATSLVSWGMAGALDPVLRAGDLVLPREVVTRNAERFPTSAAWRDPLAATLAQLSASGIAVYDGVLLTAATAIDSPADKADALRTTLAVAVDMESAAVAQVAAARALPFIAVRAIVDTAADPLPHAVLAASRAGQVQLWRLARELARSPREIAAMLRLARRYRVAKRTLRSVRPVRQSPGRSTARRRAHESVRHRRHRLRRRRRRAQAPRVRLVGARARARELRPPQPRGLAARNRRRRIIGSSLARARAVRLQRAVPRRRRLPARRARPCAALPHQRRRNPQYPRGGARRRRRTHGLHEQRRNSRHSEGRHAGRRGRRRSASPT